MFIVEYLQNQFLLFTLILSRVGALHLASLVGDEKTAGLCLRILQRRTAGEPLLTREAFLVEEHAFRTVLHRGNAQHRNELELWLSKALAQARGPESERYMKYLQSLFHGPGAAPTIRDLTTGSGHEYWDPRTR